MKMGESFGVSQGQTRPGGPWVSGCGLGPAAWVSLGARLHPALPPPPKCVGRLQVLPGPLSLRSRSKGLNECSLLRTQRLHLPEDSLMCR